MEIFVQSCGISQQHDYCWLKILETGQAYPEIPRILREASRVEAGREVRLTDLYDSQEPTVVLAQDGEELLLLVTALEASDRTKIYGRQVRNSVAWVTGSQKYKKNKQILSKIAAYITENWEYLRKAIDEAVEFDEGDGFRVNREPIEEYFEYVEYVMEAGKNEDIKQQGDNTKAAATNLKVSVVNWKTPKRINPVYFNMLLSVVLLLIPISAIAIFGKMLSDINYPNAPESLTPALSPAKQK